MTLAYVLRIFEREYYRQLDLTPGKQNLLFESYLTSVWCVIITMTTVGYGDVFAASTFGRFISVVNALWGAFIISLLVSAIGQIFDLSDTQKAAVAEITNAKNSAKSIHSFIKFILMKKEYRMANIRKRIADKGLMPQKHYDYQSTREEVMQEKQILHETADISRME